MMRLINNNNITDFGMNLALEEYCLLKMMVWQIP